jgi:hypothetical protein
MPAKLSKIAPIAAVVAILGYLSWPYLDDPAAAKSKIAAKIGEPLATLLNPKPAGDVRADLFEIPKVIGPTTAKKTSTSTSGNPAAAAKKSASAHGDELKNFVLTGTYVAGGRRYAIINGSLYSEGEQVASSGRGTKSSPAVCTVSRVEIDKVVLSFQGETKELHYADPVAPPDPRNKSAGMATSATDAAQSLTSTPAGGNVH